MRKPPNGAAYGKEKMAMFVSRFMPCAECGDSLDRDRWDGHECAPERLLDFQMFALRGEVAALETSYAAFLDTPAGRFEEWLARRDVRTRR